MASENIQPTNTAAAHAPAINEPTAATSGELNGREVQESDTHIEPAHASKDTTVWDRMEETASGSSLADHDVKLSSKKWFGLSATSLLGGAGLIAYGAITLGTLGIGGIVVGPQPLRHPVRRPPASGGLAAEQITFPDGVTQKSLQGRALVDDNNRDEPVSPQNESEYSPEIPAQSPL